jgi:hypothetical protein
MRGVQLLMFKFFKRLVAGNVTHHPRPAAVRKSADIRSRQDFSPPPPLPEVIEGDGDTDWDLWQESVNHMDSQLDPVSRFQDAGLDSAFDKVSKKDK